MNQLAIFLKETLTNSLFYRIEVSLLFRFRYFWCSFFVVTFLSSLYSTLYEGLQFWLSSISSLSIRRFWWIRSRISHNFGANRIIRSLKRLFSMREHSCDKTWMIVDVISSATYSCVANIFGRSILFSASTVDDVSTKSEYKSEHRWGICTPMSAKSPYWAS